MVHVISLPPAARFPKTMLLMSQKVSLLAPDFISTASDVFIRHRSSGVKVIRSAERLLYVIVLVMFNTPPETGPEKSLSECFSWEVGLGGARCFKAMLFYPE